MVIGEKFLSIDLNKKVKGQRLRAKRPVASALCQNQCNQKRVTSNPVARDLRFAPTGNEQLCLQPIAYRLYFFNFYLLPLAFGL
jgi:hypothetical protein